MEVRSFYLQPFRRRIIPSQNLKMDHVTRHACLGVNFSSADKELRVMYTKVYRVYKIWYVYLCVQKLWKGSDIINLGHMMMVLG